MKINFETKISVHLFDLFNCWQNVNLPLKYDVTFISQEQTESQFHQQIIVKIITPSLYHLNALSCTEVTSSQQLWKSQNLLPNLINLLTIDFWWNLPTKTYLTKLLTTHLTNSLLWTNKGWLICLIVRDKASSNLRGRGFISRLKLKMYFFVRYYTRVYSCPQNFLISLVCRSFTDRVQLLISRPKIRPLNVYMLYNFIRNSDFLKVMKIFENLCEIVNKFGSRDHFLKQRLGLIIELVYVYINTSNLTT